MATTVISVAAIIAPLVWDVLAEIGDDVLVASLGGTSGALVLWALASLVPG